MAASSAVLPLKPLVGRPSLLRLDAELGRRLLRRRREPVLNEARVHERADLPVQPVHFLRSQRVPSVLVFSQASKQG